MTRRRKEFNGAAKTYSGYIGEGGEGTMKKAGIKNKGH